MNAGITHSSLLARGWAALGPWGGRQAGPFVPPSVPSPSLSPFSPSRPSPPPPRSPRPCPGKAGPARGVPFQVGLPESPEPPERWGRWRGLQSPPPDPVAGGAGELGGRRVSVDSPFIPRLQPGADLGEARRVPAGQVPAGQRPGTEGWGRHEAAPQGGGGLNPDWGLRTRLRCGTSGQRLPVAGPQLS